MMQYGDCVFCGGEVIERRKRVEYHSGEQLYLLDNVRTGICAQCGERFYTAEVAKQMEALVNDPPENTTTVSVPVIIMR